MDLAIAAAATDVGLTTKLASLLPILDAFNYRHRNQHSASHWWSAFKQFRHGARSLAADLHRHQALNQPHTDSSKKSTAAKAKAKRAQKQLLARLALFRNHTVPKAYMYVQTYGLCIHALSMEFIQPSKKTDTLANLQSR